MKDQQITQATQDKFASKYNLEKGKRLVISTKANKTKNGNLTQDMLLCKIALDKVLSDHYKTYKVKYFDEKLGHLVEVEVKGFLDNHPRDKEFKCIRVFNIFAPRDEPKLIASSFPECITLISDQK